MRNSRLIIKKIIQFVIYFLIIYLFCLVFAQIDSSEKWVNILEFIILFIYMVLGGVFIVSELIAQDNENRKEIKKDKKYKELFDNFLDTLTNFDIYASDEIKRRDYMVAALYESAITMQMVDFYARCSFFSKEEIKETLYNTLDSEFNLFIDDVIMRFKDTIEIVFFKKRIIEYINKRLDYEDDKVYYYNSSYDFRVKIIKEKTYTIVKESYDQGSWNEIGREKGFQSDEDAYLTVTKLINYVNNAIKTNQNIDLERKDVDLKVFRILAHTYKLALDIENSEAALFRLYFYINVYGIKKYKDVIKKEDSELNLLIKSYPELKDNLILIKKIKDKKKLNVLQDSIIKEIEPLILKYIENDKYRIEE